ncbi:MAG: phosphoheptose isomerase [Legionellales bacterium]|nr:phosphoheptose isomerase [Legionellales bacterium]
MALVSKSSNFIQEIEIISLRVAKVIENNGGIFWYGNGGSAADSQHMAAELVSRFKLERRALKSQALTTDTSIITAIGNDYHFDDIFKRQVEAQVTSKDLCIGLSTSGNSQNVLKGHQAAKAIGATTVSLLGCDGGVIHSVSDYSIIVPSKDTPRVQEVHTLISHIICDIVEQYVAGALKPLQVAEQV